jgi:hypothetical protein
VNTSLIPANVASLLAADEHAEALTALESAAATVKRSLEITVTGDDSAAAAANAMLALKNEGKTIEKIREEAVRPHLDAQKAINGVFKPVVERLEKVSRQIGESLLAWRREEERKAREEAARLEKIRLDAAAAKAKADADAAAAAKANDADAALDAAMAQEAAREVVEAPRVVNPMPLAATGAIRSSAGTVSTRKVWRHRVVDPQAVPREFMSIDDGKIGSAVKAGAREIPGVEIYEAEELSRR